MFVLQKVAVVVVNVMVSNKVGKVPEAFCGVPDVHYFGEAVGPVGITKCIGKLVDHAEGTGARSQSPAGIGQDVSAEVVSDARFRVVVGKSPRAAVVGIVVGSNQAVGGVVVKAVLLLRQTGTVNGAAPLHGGDIAIVLRVHLPLLAGHQQRQKNSAEVMGALAIKIFLFLFFACNIFGRHYLRLL